GRRGAWGKEKGRAALVRGRGWQRGIRSPVRLAAMMPARRATSRTSPLARARSRMRAAVAGAMRTRPLARAWRSVSGLSLVSTIRLAPCSSKWLSSLMMTRLILGAPAGPGHNQSRGCVMTRVGGIVLCGGQSKRMGRPKAWLPFGDEVMLPRVVRLLGEIVKPVVVVAAPGQDVPPLPADMSVVRDEEKGRGPLQ